MLSLALTTAFVISIGSRGFISGSEYTLGQLKLSEFGIPAIVKTWKYLQSAGFNIPLLVASVNNGLSAQLPLSV